MSKRETSIQIEVSLDANNIPEEIHWSASDGGIVDEQAKALFLYTWNETLKESLKLDLWTKEMPVDSMKEFFYQILINLSYTYEQATDDLPTAESLRTFVQNIKINNSKS